MSPTSDQPPHPGGHISGGAGDQPAASAASSAEFLPTSPMPLDETAPADAPAGTGLPHSSSAVSDTASREGPPASSAVGPQVYAVHFGGQGGEYFKIWIVNLLLTVLTLGLYYPWAKVRKLRYFANHTYVDGHSLDFHGDPLRILRGTLLFGALLVAVNVAERVSGLAYAIAVGTLWLMFPMLWRASMRFRLANTSWRGLRMRFTGDVGGAYLPFACLYLLALGMGLAVGFSDAALEGLDPNQKLVAAKRVAWLMGLGFLLWPALEYLLKRYQHSHYQLGQWQTRFQTGPWGFYKVYLKLVGLILLPLIVLSVVIIAFIGVGMAAGADQQNSAVMGALIGGFAALLMVFLVQLCVKPYLATRMQNLVWHHTGHPQIQFRSRLRFRDYLPAYLLNGLLTFLTLGLYWPVAQIALAKLRLQAITIESQVPLSSAVAQWLAHPERDATGDAAGDLLGFDISL